MLVFNDTCVCTREIAPAQTSPDVGCGASWAVVATEDRMDPPNVLDESVGPDDRMGTSCGVDILDAALARSAASVICCPASISSQHSSIRKMFCDAKAMRSAAVACCLAVDQPQGDSPSEKEQRLMKRLQLHLLAAIRISVRQRSTSLNSQWPSSDLKHDIRERLVRNEQSISGTVANFARGLD